MSPSAGLQSRKMGFNRWLTGVIAVEFNLVLRLDDSPQLNIDCSEG